MDFVQRSSASRRERDDAIPARESVVWDAAVNIVENRTGRLFVSLHGTDVVDTTNNRGENIRDGLHSSVQGADEAEANKEVANDVKPERGSRLSENNETVAAFCIPSKRFKAPLMCVLLEEEDERKEEAKKRIKNPQPRSIFN